MANAMNGNQIHCDFLVKKFFFICVGSSPMCVAHLPAGLTVRCRLHIRFTKHMPKEIGECGRRTGNWFAEA
jgi:hypothetical protein